MSSNPLGSSWSFTPSKPTQINSVSMSNEGSFCAFGSSYERGTGDFYTYLYDGDGNRIWKKPITTGTSYQGVFWVGVSGNGTYVASGGETKDTQATKSKAPTPTVNPGYLKAYSTDATGTLLLDKSLSHRINQVSFSDDGQYLAVCYGVVVEVFKLKADKSAFVSIYSQTLATSEVISCVISADGSTVVASGKLYTSGAEGEIEGGMTGSVYSYSVVGDVVTELTTCVLTSACMRVAIVDSGQYWAASLHDGSCMLFNRINPGTCLWHCKPEQAGLMLAYAVDVTETDSGDIYVACGANLSGSENGGFLYLVKSERFVYDEKELKYPAPIYKGVLQWSKETKYGVNPGVSLDKNATHVTATDGKPDGNSKNESPGAFYLFSIQGDLIWEKKTSIMNWPMEISKDASTILAGSDDGSVYCWKSPFN